MKTYDFEDHPNQDAIIEWCFNHRPVFSCIHHDNDIAQAIAEDAETYGTRFTLEGEPTND